MLNRVVLMGRLTADPELRHTPNDIAVTTFTLAVERSYVKQGAERPCDFIDVVAWRNQAEFVTKYFHKGQLVAVEGSLQTRTYTDKEGRRRKVYEVVADALHFAEPKRDYSNSLAFRSDNQPEASYIDGDTGDFEEIQDDDDLPF